MTSVPWAPVQVAAQVHLLAAQSTVAEGSVSAEVFGVALTSGVTESVDFVAGSRRSGIGQPSPARPGRGEEVLMP